MKILFGISSFYPENRAGTETYVLNLAKELSLRKYDISVIFPAVGKKIVKYVYEGIKVFTFQVPSKLSTKELNGLDKISGFDEFIKILNDIKPDVFHLHSLSRSFHAEHIKSAKQKGIKTVFTGHLGSTFCINDDIQLFQKKICNAFVNKNRCLACFIKKNKNYSIFLSKILSFVINLIIKTSLKYKFPEFNIVKYKLIQHQLLKKYSDSNIAIATWLKQAYINNNFNEISQVNQGINSNFLGSKKQPKNCVPYNLIFIGRAHPDKGIHLILESLKDFKNSFNLTVITIPFRDEKRYYDKIKYDYESLGYKNWFENISQDEVSEQLNISDILILPSKYEAAPLVILEAFAKKIPVIASNIIAIKDIIKHNFNGLIFQNGNVKSLIKQLQKIIEEPGLIKRFSDNIKNPRTYKDVCGDMCNIYNKLLDKKE